MRTDPKSTGNSCRAAGLLSLFGRARLLLVLGVFLAGDAWGSELTYGPLAHEFELTLESGRRQEVAGPLFSAEYGRDWERWTFSPFLRYTYDRALDATEFDLLYPLFTYDRFGSEYKLKLLFLTSFAGGRDQAEEEARRFTIFPFVFVQRSTVPEENYAAVLPIHGRVQNRFGRDDLWWTAWPLYVGSRRKDVVTQNYLFPVVHTRRGDGLRGWQVWPFYGTETKSETLITNDFGDTELVPGHRKSFLFWPVYFHQDLGLGTTNLIRHRMVLPFYSDLQTPEGDSRSYLWPLFNVIDNRAKNYREWQMPWPFVVFARGPGKTTDRVLPIYSYARSDTRESGFILWPLYKVNRAMSPPLMRERKRIFFFFYSQVHETNTWRQTVSSRTDLWPLFAYRRDHEGRERFQAPALLESFLPLNRPINHVYTPLWAVWRNQKNPETQASSQSALWNLYRRDRTPETTKVSLLFGLFQYQSAPEMRRVKLFFVPLGRSPARSELEPDPEIGAE
jgi:hypothetical protein